MLDITKSDDFVPHRVMRRAMDATLRPLRKAIHAAVAATPGAVVIDVATGGGLLAAWAAECPSTALVYAVEDDPLMLGHATRALADHPRRQVIQIVGTGNLLEYQCPQPCDVLLCDVASTALLRQPQAALINHYLPFTTGAVLPAGLRTTATLVELDFRFAEGLVTVSHPFEDIGNATASRVITTASAVSTESFGQPVPSGVARSVRLRAIRAGVAGAVRLESRYLVGGAPIARSSSAFPPVVVPLPEPHELTEGQSVTLWCRLRYRQADVNNRATAGSLPGAVEVSLVQGRAREMAPGEC